MFLESVKLIPKNAIALPFVANDTPLTGQVTSGRQFATVTVSMDRISRIPHSTRSTLNHMALTSTARCIAICRIRGVELKQPITIRCR